MRARTPAGRRRPWLAGWMGCEGLESHKNTTPDPRRTSTDSRETATTVTHSPEISFRAARSSMRREVEVRALGGTATGVLWQGWWDALRRRGGPPWLGGWGWMTGREEGVTYLRSACERVAAMRVIAPSNFWERSRRRTRDELGRLPSFTTTLPSTPTRRPSVAVGRVWQLFHVSLTPEM